VEARVIGASAILAAVVVVVVVSVGGVASAAGKREVTVPQSTGQAMDGPGSESYFDLARKDCVGTARNTTSKAWFTVAGGVLSDTVRRMPVYPLMFTLVAALLRTMVWRPWLDGREMVAA